jgi:hypothetical protein
MVNRKTVADIIWAHIDEADEQDCLFAADDIISKVINPLWAERNEILQDAGADELGLIKRAEAAEAQVEALRKVRDGYASQAKFADHEPAAYFREFVRRIDAALSAPAEKSSVDPWRPISTMPEHDALILAATADGRMMIWSTKILRLAMEAGTPNHLQFPAIAWMPLPPPPEADQ